RDGFRRERTVLQLLPALAKLFRILGVTEQPVKKVVRQAGGASTAGGVSIASESSVVIPWNKEEGLFVGRSLPIARDHEIFVDAIEVAGEQHQKVEVDRIREVEPC